MTVLKDVRTLVGDAITAAVAYLDGRDPEKTNTYNNGKIDVPAKPSAIVTVTKDNVKAAVIDSGYYPASDFTGLDSGTAPAATAAGEHWRLVGIVLPTKDEPRWIQDETRFKDAFTEGRLRCPDPVQPGRLRQGKGQRRSADQPGHQSPHHLPAGRAPPPPPRPKKPATRASRSSPMTA